MIVSVFFSLGSIPVIDIPRILYVNIKDKLFKFLFLIKKKTLKLS